MEQVLMNLASHAREAMPGGGKLIIRTADAELGAEETSRYPYVKPGHYVHLSVSDTGTAMTEEVMARLFEPLFTATDPRGGTGVGLAMVYAIVKQSGGYIWVSSEPGAGRTFDIYLPKVDQLQTSPLPEVCVRPLYPGGIDTKSRSLQNVRRST
jgi:two-component system cell cycle sensor histidine kinase/response regulator CckA